MTQWLSFLRGVVETSKIGGLFLVCGCGFACRYIPAVCLQTMVEQVIADTSCVLIIPSKVLTRGYPAPRMD